MTDEVKIQLPRYQSHKEVGALKIAGIEFDVDVAKIEDRDTDGSAKLFFENDRYAPIKVPHEYVRKHQPKAGGYYVVYESGYTSWSPAEAFESGYTLIA